MKDLILYSKICKILKINNKNSKLKLKIENYYGKNLHKNITDLEELNYNQVKDKSMLKYWRYHSTIKIYKSITVTKAIHYMLTNNVPGLKKEGKPVTYKNVFDEIQNLPWPGDVFLIGGTVRDTLKRTAPNDIDIAVSCPPNDIKKICEKNKWKFYINTKYSYFMIGNKDNDEYLEGKDIYNNLNSLTQDEFRMNNLFYDLKNDIIIDKTGKGVQDTFENKLNFCVEEKLWNEWMHYNFFFRFYKFILRDYQVNWKQKRFILSEFKKIYKPKDHFRCVIMFKRLKISKEKLIEIINQDLNDVFLYDEKGEYKSWYEELINSF